MLGKESEMWPADPLPNVTLITVRIQITHMGYLEEASSLFTEHSDGGIEKSNKLLIELNTTAIIPEINNQNLMDLIDLKVKRINRKKEKFERRLQRKINLA